MLCPPRRRAHRPKTSERRVVNGDGAGDTATRDPRSSPKVQTMQRLLIILAVSGVLSSVGACSEGSSSSSSSANLPPTFAGSTCVADEQCSAPTPICDLASSTCVGCVADEDCKEGQTCSNGGCSVQGECDQGDRICNGNDLWTCNAEGSSFATFNCPET